MIAADSTAPAEQLDLAEIGPTTTVCPQRSGADGTLCIDGIGILMDRREIGFEPDRFAFVTNHQAVVDFGVFPMVAGCLVFTQVDAAQPAAANRAIANGMKGTHQVNSLMADGLETDGQDTRGHNGYAVMKRFSSNTMRTRFAAG